MGTKCIAEFRLEAVRVALTSDLTRKQVASDSGIVFLTRKLMSVRGGIAPIGPALSTNVSEDMVLLAHIREKHGLSLNRYALHGS